MTAEALGLGGVSVLVLGASLGVVLARNLFHAVLWLALALVGTAGLFVLLHAEFLAAVQVLLYAGGVVTIVVFAIMLTERLVGDSIRQTNRGISAGRWWPRPFRRSRGDDLRAPRAAPPPPPDLTTATLGRAVLTEWVLAFEVLGILLVAALLGALSSPARRSERAARVPPARGGHVRDRPVRGPDAPECRRHPPRPRAHAERGQHRPGCLRALRRGAAGWVFALFTIAITVTEVAVGLAIVIVIFRVRRTVDADHLNLLRG